MRIEIKPLSVNRCWQGRRFKTKDYKAYETELLLKLPKIEVSEGDKRLDITVGLSNSNQDLDNIAKPFIDVLQKRYGFNDREIKVLCLQKIKVKKGEEFVEFNFVINN